MTMLNQFSRTELLFGADAMQILADSRVAVFGIGGVGGFTAEALVRSGIGAIDIIDDENAQKAGVPIISSMGAGNKLDPTAFKVADISKTSVCPLAKTMRRECKKRGINHLKCVYSEEPAMTPIDDDQNSCKHHCICPPDTKRNCTIRRQVPGSTAFVPSVVGLIIAGEVIKDLTGVKNEY